MTMKDHILAAMQEQFERWQAFLDDLDEAAITTPHFPSTWTLKDEVVHLWAWQQRTLARVEAALAGREPEFPAWLPGVDPDKEVNTGRINDWIYKTYMDEPWADVHRRWREGYRRLLDLSAQIAEKDLLDGSRYPWLDGYPLALILLATYDHHQEHLDNLLPWLSSSGNASTAAAN